MSAESEKLSELQLKYVKLCKKFDALKAENERLENQKKELQKKLGEYKPIDNRIKLTIDYEKI